MVTDASVADAYRDFGNKFYYLKLQGQWAILGIIGLFFGIFFDYRKLKPLAVPMLGATIITLLLVIIPGVGTKMLGARRWLNIGFINFQPAELSKFTLIVYLASLFSSRPRATSFFAVLIVVLGLVMLEPDLGTAIVLSAIAFSMFFTSGVSVWQFLGTVFLGGLGAILAILGSSYRRQRLLTFFNPENDPLGNSYHIRQVLIALGSGGIFGVGFGQSRQKYEYLPEVTTDSIFAVIAEELGFFGGVVLILAFLLFINRGMKIARRAPDSFGRLLALGITSWIGFQALLNLAAMTALLPLTGIPLPFISYGGSSLVLVMVATGILLGISRKSLSD